LIGLPYGSNWIHGMMVNDDFYITEMFDGGLLLGNEANRVLLVDYNVKQELENYYTTQGLRIDLLWHKKQNSFL
jgi:hypothetical protein